MSWRRFWNHFDAYKDDPGQLIGKFEGLSRAKPLWPAVLKQLERARRQCGNTVLTDVVW